MKANYKIFTIPISTPDDLVNELNQFVQTHQIIKISKDLVKENEQTCWCFLIEYLSGSEAKKQSKPKSKIDYREVLSPEDFTLYAQIRDWRKKIAEKEGIALYSVLTNEQMARISQDKITSIEQLKKVDGIGDQRLKKYSGNIVQIVKEFMEQKNKRESAKKQAS